MEIVEMMEIADSILMMREKYLHERHGHTYTLSEYDLYVAE